MMDVVESDLVFKCVNDFGFLPSIFFSEPNLSTKSSYVRPTKELNKKIISRLPNKIDHLISIMERVKNENCKLHMKTWYFGYEYSEVFSENHTIESLNSCGTAACFAGWCVLDNEIKKDDTKKYQNPVDILTDYLSEKCRSAPRNHNSDFNTFGYVETMISCVALFGEQFDSETNYGVPMEEVTVDMVIEKLNWFKKHVYALLKFHKNFT